MSSPGPVKHRPALEAALISGLALALYALAAAFIQHPGYMDAYYYFGGALQLARGHGLIEPYLWNYLDPVLRLPHPSHLYWMPLASLAAAPFIALADWLAGSALPAPAAFRAAQVPFVLLAACLPAVSYAAARRATGQARHARMAALLTVFSAFYVVYWPNTDAFALFGLSASIALLLGDMAAGQAGGRLHFAAGVCAGLAHLARADGLLVLPVLLLWMAPGWLRQARAGDRLSWLRPAALLAAGYLLVMLPWFARNLLVMGAPLAPGGLRMLWLTRYDDIFNYPADDLTLVRFLASGWESILAGRALALRLNLGTVIGPLTSIVALPFSLAGLWQLRRQPVFRLSMLYGVLLLAAMTFFFAYPGARGGLFHSGAALLPFLFAAAPAGLEAGVQAAARRLPHWRPEKSGPVFGALLVLCAAALTGVVFKMRVLGPDWRRPQWGRADEVYSGIGQRLDCGQPGPPVVISNNPPGFYYFTGCPGVYVPNGDLAVLRRAAADFGARWLVLDHNHPAGLAGVYAAPRAQPGLALRATFFVEGKPVYLLELAENVALSK